MPTPDFVKRVAALASAGINHRIRVSDIDGKVYDLIPGLDETPARLTAEQRFEELDTQLRTTMSMVNALALKLDSISERLESMLTVLQGAVAGQARFSESADRLAEALNMPIEPIYDANGKLIGARRVPHLGD